MYGLQGLTKDNGLRVEGPTHSLVALPADFTLAVPHCKRDKLLHTNCTLNDGLFLSLGSALEPDLYQLLPYYSRSVGSRKVSMLNAKDWV